MRAIFGVLSLLLVLAAVGLLVKKQLASTQQATPSLTLPAVSGAQTAPAQPVGTVQEPSQPIQQQYKQALDAAMQARPMPDEK